MIEARTRGLFAALQLFLWHPVDSWFMACHTLSVAQQRASQGEYGMATRYARETGRTWQRFNKPTDPQSIQYLARCRKAPRWSAGHDTYREIVASVCAPTLRSLVRAEARVAA